LRNVGSPETQRCRRAAGAPDYPDKLDAKLLRIAGLCCLARVMVFLDNTIVAVAQRTFVARTRGALLCAMTPNILPLINFRAIQDIVGGMSLPLSFVILTASQAASGSAAWSR
jgi:MFS transporter, DHA2 family, multidrug resistance protein